MIRDEFRSRMHELVIGLLGCKRYVIVSYEDTDQIEFEYQEWLIRVVLDDDNYTMYLYVGNYQKEFDITDDINETWKRFMNNMVNILLDIIGDCDGKVR